MRYHLVNVFVFEGQGGHECPIVTETQDLDTQKMQAFAALKGRECVFVLPGNPTSDYDLQLRYFVPNHEMEMCGHATVGAIWLLFTLGQLNPRKVISIQTLSGKVLAKAIPPSSSPSPSPSLARDSLRVAVHQPKGTVTAVPASLRPRIAHVLNITEQELDKSTAIQTASTSRAKTLIPLRTPEAVNAIIPQADLIRGLCDTLGSTGLYIYAAHSTSTGTDTSTSTGTGAGHLFEARQFPRASGYLEDPATGIAASALAYGLLAQGAIERDSAIAVRQGFALGEPSEIRVEFAGEREGDGDGEGGCWVSGAVVYRGERGA